MKINEKNLIAYSLSREHIDKEGYLLIKGEVSKVFQRRWFILKGNLLFYFEKKGDKEPVGVIILEGCRAELAESEEHFVFKLIFSGSTNLRVYELSAESQEEMESWMKYISRASYDYLKLMVVELQKQLEDIEESEKSSCSRVVVPPTTLCSFPSSVFHKPRENPFNKNEEVSFNDLWKCDESLLNAASLLSKYSKSPCGLGYGKVNPSLPLSIPFRAAPPPPIVKAPSAKNPIAKISFSFLHAKYGEKILQDRTLYTQVKMRRVLEMRCMCDKGVFVVDVNEENLIEL